MKAFMCTNGIVTRCDSPGIEGDVIAIADQLGFAVYEADTHNLAELTCAVCRPKNNQDVFLTIHGIERNIYAMVIWQQADTATFILVPTPFDLVTAIEYVTRYERAMHDLREYARLRDERERVPVQVKSQNGRAA